MVCTWVCASKYGLKSFGELYVDFCLLEGILFVFINILKMLNSSHYGFPFTVSETTSLKPVWSIFPITSLQQGLGQWKRTVEQTVLLASRGTFLPLLLALLVFCGNKDWEEMSVNTQQCSNLDKQPLYCCKYHISWLSGNRFLINMWFHCLSTFVFN